MDKKSILIGVLATLVLILSGYLVYDKIIAKDKTEKVESNEKVEEESKGYDLAEAKALVEKYTIHFLYWDRLFEEGLDSELKILLALENTSSTEKTIDCKKAFSVSADDWFVVAGEEIGVCYEWRETSVYSYDALNKTYKSLFGPNEEMPKTQVGMPYSCAYSKYYDAYISLSCECGGAYYQQSYYEVVSAEELDGTLNVTVNYASFDLSNYEDPWEVDLKKLYNEAVNNGDYEKFIFTFKNSDNGYYLTSMSK